MKKVAEKNGAVFHLGTSVVKVITKNKKTIGVELSDGKKILYDSVVVNADF